MGDPGRPTLLLARVPVSVSAFPAPLRSKVTKADLVHLKPKHVLIADQHGGLYEVALGESHATSYVASQYELYLKAPDDEEPQLVRKSWSSFVAQEDGIIFSQTGSNKLLFVQLPMVEGDCSGAFLFGAHSAEVTCMLGNKGYLVSGSADGSVMVWALADGQLLDSKEDPTRARITALAWVGPLMIAAGNEEGYVTVYDVSSKQLMPVQRFFVDNGPVTQLSARLTPTHLSAILTSSAPRSADGGGVVQAPAGLPWRIAPHALDAPAEAPTDALLAVASTAGWLHVYQARMPGELAWQRQYSGSHYGSVRLAFSPDGGYLAMSSGLDSGTLVLLDTTSWAAVQQWSFPSCLADLGFLDPGAELAVFPDTLATAVKLSMFACPARELPVVVQAKLPYIDPQQQRARDPVRVMDGLRTASQAPSDPLPSSYRPTNVVSPYSLSPDRATAAASARAMQQQEAGLGQAPGVMPRPSLRPSTLPATRSWLTGGPPPVIDVSDVAPPAPAPEVAREYSQEPVQYGGSAGAASSGLGTDPHADEADMMQRPLLHTMGAPTWQAFDRYGGSGRATQESVASVHMPPSDQGLDDDEPLPRSLPAHIMRPSAGAAGSGATVQRAAPLTSAEHALPAQASAASISYAPAVGVAKRISREGADILAQAVPSSSPPQAQGRGSRNRGTAAASSSYTQNSAVGASQDSFASGDLGGLRQHEFERAAFFGDRLQQMDVHASVESRASAQLQQQPADAKALLHEVDEEEEEEDEPLPSDSVTIALPGGSVGADGQPADAGITGPDGNDQLEEEQEEALYQATADFVSNPPQRTVQQPQQPARPLHSNGAAPKPAPAPQAQAGYPVQQRDRRAIGLRAPRAPGYPAGRLHVEEADEQAMATAGSPGRPPPGSVVGGVQPSPARPPFRGYKPHVSKIIQEIRRKGTQSPAPKQQQAGQRDSHAQDERALQPQMAQPDASARQQQLAAPSSVASPVLMGSPASSMMRALGDNGARAGATAQGGAVFAGAGAQERDVSPLQRPQVLSTHGILRKMQELSMAEPTGLAGMTQAQKEEAARLAANTAANLPPGVQMYSGLQPIDGVVHQNKMAKQLHPGWKASRQLKPELRALWRAEDQQQEVCSTTGLALYTRPHPESVAAMALSIF